MNLFAEISILLAITTMVTLVLRLLKQPLVVGYILSGIVVGPSLLNVLQSHHEIEFFSKVGIVFLLFIVGLHLNPKVIKEVGGVSLLAGIGQIVFTTLIGFGIALLLGLSNIAALYVAIALTLSSTIIILKLLTDKKDLQKLYAKITIGFLLVQDIVATLILIGITVFATSNSSNITQTLLFTLTKGVGLLIGLLLISILILPRLTKYLANSQELLFLFSLAWGTGLASLFSFLGFSIEIGALVAGVSLAATPYADEMATRLKPLRDFFVVMFFILLGSQLQLANIGQIILPAFVLSIFVLVGNPIIVILLMNILGFSRKTGFMAGLTVAQISEFSLILATLGLRVGHLSPNILSLITLVGLFTIAGSTYLILYGEKLYAYFAKYLTILELIKKRQRDRGSVGENYTALIFGYDRVGHLFVDALKDIDPHFLVIDFNPASIERLTKAEIPCRYGDASDVEFLEEIPASKPRLVISTIPETSTNLAILKDMRGRNDKVIIIVIAHTVAEAHQLYGAGASLVIMPHHLGAHYAAQLIKKHQFNEQAYGEEKEQHLTTLLRNYG